MYAETIADYARNYTSKEQKLLLKGKAKIKDGKLITLKKGHSRQRIKKSDVSLSELLELSSVNK